MWERWTEGTPRMPHMCAVICRALLEDKFWTALPKSQQHPSSLPLWFGLSTTDSWSDYIIVLLLRTVPPLRREGCHRRAPPQMAVLPARTCESFGPKLFIWLLLSATSVSSVHLCPLWKKKKNHPPPPFQNSMSLWAIYSFGMTTNKIGPN